jgi:hypothetical protein
LSGATGSRDTGRVRADVAARRRKPALRAALLVLLALGSGTAWAHAGTYTFSLCRTASGGPGAGAGTSVVAAVPALDRYSDRCPVAGRQIELAPWVAHNAGDSMRLLFTAPPDTQIARYEMWRSVQVARGQHYYFTHVENRSGVEMSMKPECEGMTCGAVGNPATPIAGVNLFDRTPPVPVDSFGLYIACRAPAGQTCAATPNLAVRAIMFRADVTLSDGFPPLLLAPPGGALMEPGALLSGVQNVSLLASDRGGGVADGIVEVDGERVARATLDTNHGACVPPYTTRVPCPATAGGTVSLDTDQLPDGPHELRLIVTDVAGNETSWGPMTIRTDNLDAACNPMPRLSAGAPVSLRTWFLQRVRGRTRVRSHGVRVAGPTRLVQRTRITRRQGARPLLRGTIADAAGRPLAGARVCVASRVPGLDALPRPLERVTADAAGTIAVRLPAGPSRELWTIYRSGGAAIVARTLVRVPARVSLTAGRAQLRAGQLLRIRGRVRGRPIPPGGVLVSVQARRGRDWQTFRQARVRGDGRYRVDYRFHGQPGVHAYQLRALVPEQSGYPYTAAHSRAFTVRVSG